MASSNDDLQFNFYAVLVLANDKQRNDYLLMTRKYNATNYESTLNCFRETVSQMSPDIEKRVEK
jgi:hypothetical protein